MSHAALNTVRRWSTRFEQNGATVFCLGRRHLPAALPPPLEHRGARVRECIDGELVFWEKAMSVILKSILDLQMNVFVCLDGFLGPDRPVYLKLEGVNPTGSIKIKPAQHMIEDLETRGVLQPGIHKVVESSSGNLGVALALVCKARGYPFTCISDGNANPAHLAHIRCYGGTVEVVREPDRHGGFLHKRLERIQQLLHDDPTYVWTNQYANPANPRAHYRTTGPEIHRTFPDLDYLFVGAGTTGTLLGCARYYREHAPHTTIVAVDSVGSVTFGGPAAARHIPGLGTSRPPEISVDVAALRPIPIRALLMIPEPETVRMCYEVLQRYSLWIGGSTGTVLCGVRQYQDCLPAQATVVAISADFGERYTDTLYNPGWVAKQYGADVANPTPTEVAL